MKKTIVLLGALILAVTSWTLAQPSGTNSWAGAMWVWDEPDANSVAQNNEPRYLRLAFNLPATPQAAELWVTADNLYVAYVNGHKVGADDEWATVEKYDVAKHLVAGKNVLAIKATNAGGVAGAIARLHVKTADKKDLFIVTNEKTKIQRAGSESDGWIKTDFDDSAWFAAIVLGDPSIGPWNIAGSAVSAKGKGKGGPTDYGSNAVDPKVTKRLSAQEQIKHFIVPKDFEIELVAADPVVINPITMVLDDKGRIIVSESHTYRYGPPGSPIKPFANPVVRLDPDGKGGFTRTLVADGFADPVMGIAVKGDKLWLTACDYLYTYDLPNDPPAKQDAMRNEERGIRNEELNHAHLAPNDVHFAPKGQQQDSPGQSAAPPWLRTPPQDIALKGQNKTGTPALLRPYRASEPTPTEPRALPWAHMLLPVRGEFRTTSSFLIPRSSFLIAHLEETAAEGKTPPPNPDAGKKPLATNKKLLLKDHSKAWNPFGMFVLEWGPDGKLYMSVGNHNINIEGPDGGKISARGSSGMIMRMNPDGTKMERLVHGLRVPYSFEYDPFGQLWLLSNGEGNPDRFVRVIEGVDYHCYSRSGVDNEWLAGRHPLAPPCEEVHGGAHTQLMRYYAANFPQEYQGNLFACNWGRHGFAGANRGIFRFVLDDRNNVVKKDTLVACTDPHFRPSHIHLDVDGSLLIADWYGRDDESDMTGRIWRLKYVGKDRPVVKHKLDSPEWKNDDYAIEALGSPDHLVREKAISEMTKRANRPILLKLSRQAATSGNPLAAANSLWLLSRIDSPDSAFLINKGINNADWRVRCLSINLGPSVIAPEERDPAVRLEAAIGARDPGLIFDALQKGAAADPFLRYKGAWALAHSPGKGNWEKLLASDDANMRLAGLISIDLACNENQWAVSQAARAALAKAIENPGKLDHQLLLTVAQLDGDASIVPALEKLISRDDLPTATIAKAVLVLKAKSGGSLASSKLSAAAGKRLIEAVEKGSLKIASPADQLVMFEFLEAEGPTPFALKQIEGQLRSNNKELKQAAHTLARRFGPKADPLAAGLWPSVQNPKTKFEDTLEYLSTIARVEAKPDIGLWTKMLEHDDPFVRTETVRWWRIFKGRSNFEDNLIRFAPALVAKDAGLRDDVQAVQGHLAILPVKTVDKDKLTNYALEELTKMPAADRPKRAAMGLQVFERNACTRCHTTATTTTPLAPSLKGVAQQKAEYLIESVLYPSKIIKTGWEVEVIEFKNGRVLTGLVKDDGKFLRVFTASWWKDGEVKVAKADIESRTLSKTSIMPEGQEAELSRREFVDLIAYLQTLK